MTNPQPFGPVLHRARIVRPANDTKPVDPWDAYLAKCNADYRRDLYREAIRPTVIDRIALVVLIGMALISSLLVVAM